MSASGDVLSWRSQRTTAGPFDKLRVRWFLGGNDDRNFVGFEKSAVALLRDTPPFSIKPKRMGHPAWWFGQGAVVWGVEVAGAAA